MCACVTKRYRSGPYIDRGGNTISFSATFKIIIVAAACDNVTKVYIIIIIIIPLSSEVFVIIIFLFVHHRRCITRITRACVRITDTRFYASRTGIRRSFELYKCTRARARASLGRRRTKYFVRTCSGCPLYYKRPRLSAV